MHKYVFYFRVSTKKQGESRLGLDAQRTYIEHFYKDKPVIGEFTELVSGKDIVNRPELQKAIALCKKEHATLVVAKIDRLSRNTEDALLIYKELHGRLESCDIPNLDKFTLTLFMAIADRERELIMIRTKAALAEKIKRSGEWRKGSEPFKDKSAQEKARDIIKEKARSNENTRKAANYIKMLRNQAIGPPDQPGSKAGKLYTWQQIADQLNEEGFKTARGKAFMPMQVQRIYKRFT